MVGVRMLRSLALLWRNPPFPPVYLLLLLLAPTVKLNRTSIHIGNLLSIVETQWGGCSRRFALLLSSEECGFLFVRRNERCKPRETRKCLFFLNITTESAGLEIYGLRMIGPQVRLTVDFFLICSYSHAALKLWRKYYLATYIYV